MRLSTSKQLHINNHLKAHLEYKFCPMTLGIEDVVYDGTRESSTLTTRPPAPPQ